LAIFTSLVLFCVIPIILINGATSTGEIICQNLINADAFDSELQCLESSWSPDFAPYYFPIGKVNLEYVELGMADFELLDVWRGTCMDGSSSITLNYGLASFSGTYLSELTFYFCDERLSDMSYHN
jgi:hypothetical protein